LRRGGSSPYRNPRGETAPAAGLESGRPGSSLLLRTRCPEPDVVRRDLCKGPNPSLVRAKEEGRVVVGWGGVGGAHAHA